MRYLIDGHNWFFASVDFDKDFFQNEHKIFLERIKNLLSSLKGESIIVFDGGLHGDQVIYAHIERIKIIYTGSKQSADDRLLEILSFQQRSTLSTLVSSDTSLIRSARKLGAKILCPEAFEALIISKRRKKEDKKLIPCDPLLQEYYVDIFTKRLKQMRESDLE